MSKIIRQVNYKKIALSGLKPGMVLARDIAATNGFVLLAKDTMINQSNFRRLVESGIREVYIKEATINREADNLMDTMTGPEPEPLSVLEKEDFKEFSSEYDKKVEIAKTQIRAISEGKSVDISELYDITSSVMSKLRSKSDVLTYISFLKEHDEYTFSHSSNVAMLCNLFASWLGNDEAYVMNLTTAGLLHDIGKLKIPLEILNKKGRLNDEEFNVIKNHTVLGYRILQGQSIPEDLKMAALMHHERIDGSGYPLKVLDKQINDYAKIIAICDIYDAMTANRVYRARICPFDVIKQFEVSSYGELDTAYLLMFLRNIAYTYFGSWVKLSNGMEGEIVFIHQNDLSRPVVRCGGDIIDIQKAPDVKIDDVL